MTTTYTQTNRHDISKSRVPELIKHNFERFSNIKFHEDQTSTRRILRRRPGDMTSISDHYETSSSTQTNRHDISTSRFPQLIKHSFQKFSNIQFHEYPTSTSQVLPRRQTDMKNVIDTSRN